jgi:AcrR family transcriptional regulator
MTPGALYWHFPTKEDLLLSAIEELHTRFVAGFQPILEEARAKKWPAAKQLKAFMEHTGQYLHVNREHGIFFGMIGTESAENDDAVAAALRDALSVYVAAVEQILVYGQTKTKEFRADVDTKTLAHAIIFGNVGIIAQHNLFREGLSYIPLVQALSNMVLDGFLIKR